MTGTNKYQNIAAFKMALEARLKAKAARMDRPYPTLRKLLAFDRLLARIFSDREEVFALKGGYSLELRLGRSRTTQDVDLVLRDRQSLDSSIEDQGDAIKMLLQDKLENDLGDFFSFRLGRTRRIEAASIGGYRIQTTALLSGTFYEEFLLDVAIAETDATPLEELQGEPWLDFANIEQAKPLAIPKELQFAEKIHAYTFPWQGRENTREKDLIDMVMLINQGLNPEKTRARIESVFSVRNSHALPSVLNKPPGSWGKVFDRMAEELNYAGSVSNAFDTVSAFFNEHLTPDRK